MRGKLKTKFQHVNNLWDNTLATKLSPVELPVYRSNCLGADQHVPNTGGDLRTAKTENFSFLSEQKLLDLQQIYAAYYEKCRHPNSPAMRDPNPTVILIPGLGLIVWGNGKSGSHAHKVADYTC